MTVTIQTFNHADYLKTTLESLKKIHCPEGIDYEILIVDNNSTDNTAAVIQYYAKILAPRLRSVFEKRQGLSFARNRAIDEARGDIICFIDDDVKVNEDWLEAVFEAFRKYNPAVVGGKSYLIYLSEKPKWLTKQMEVLLSKLDYGDEVEVGTNKELFGLNFSVLKKAAIEVGGFDTNLGRNGKNLVSGEEKAFLERIRSKGGLVVYEPKAAVGHLVPPERLTKRWFLRRIYSQGVSSERSSILAGEKVNLSKLFFHTLRCWLSLGKSLIMPGISDEKYFERKYYAFWNLGKLMEKVRYQF